MTTEASNAPSPVTRVLLVRLGEEWFALPADSIREIVRWREPTAVPGAPSALLGIFNLRGTILPMIDPHPLLNVSQAPRARSTRLVTLESGEYSAALLVDEVRDLVHVEEEREPALPGSTSFTAGLLTTEHGRVALLEPAAIFDLIRGG